MTRYIPLGESKFDPIAKTLKLKGSHLEETVNGNLSVTNGDTMLYGEIEVKSDGSYELIEDGLSLTDLPFQEKFALQDRVMKQWQESDKDHKYYRRQEIKENIIDFCKLFGLLLGMSAVVGGSAYLVQELIKYFNK